MTVYCGVDFHARQQTVCYCDTADGEIQLGELDHQADDVRGFYSRFTGEVVVGLEASGYSTWFIELVEGFGHRFLSTVSPPLHLFVLLLQDAGHPDKQVCDNVAAIQLVEHFVPAARIEVVCD